MGLAGQFPENCREDRAVSRTGRISSAVRQTWRRTRIRHAKERQFPRNCFWFSIPEFLWIKSENLFRKNPDKSPDKNPEKFLETIPSELPSRLRPARDFIGVPQQSPARDGTALGSYAIPSELSRHHMTKPSCRAVEMSIQVGRRHLGKPANSRGIAYHSEGSRVCRQDGRGYKKSDRQSGGRTTAVAESCFYPSGFCFISTILDIRFACIVATASERSFIVFCVRFT